MAISDDIINFEASGPGPASSTQDCFSSSECVECSQPDITLRHSSNGKESASSTMRAVDDDEWGDESTQGAADVDDDMHEAMSTPRIFVAPTKPKITVSRVDNNTANRAKRLADATGCTFFLDSNEVPTHVVVGSQPRASMLLLKSISRGCWVLNAAWIDDSLAAGRLQDEEDYEVRSVEGCRRARIARS